MNRKNIILVGCLSLFLVVCSSQKSKSFFRESGSFIYALFKNPTRIGAVAPSSSYLAKAIVKNIEKKDRPLKILEVGAGTGSFTEKIIQKMDQQDLLDVVELDASLCDILRKKFGEHKNVTIHCMSVLDFNADTSYDFIISGLPFNVFASDLVYSIVDKYKRLIKSNGIISYFEYMFAANIKKIFLFGNRKVDFIKNMTILADFRREFLIEKNRVFFNFPPAYAYHLQIKK